MGRAIQAETDRAPKRRHRHQRDRVAGGRFQFSFRFLWPENVERPRSRKDCTPCPVCQKARDHGVTPLSCGHRGQEVVWHSRPCIFARCRHSLTVDVCGCSVVLNAPEREGGESCVLDVADSRPSGCGSDLVASILGTTRERAEELEARALGKLRAALGE